jgi:dipeptidase E
MRSGLSSQIPRKIAQALKNKNYFCSITNAVVAQIAQLNNFNNMTGIIPKIILGSTSTLSGQTYLQYLRPVLENHFAGIKRLLFVPYARPGGIDHAQYTASAANFFETLGIAVDNLAAAKDPALAIKNAEAIFTGGGNTFVLVQQLHQLGLMSALKQRVLEGAPYLGTSAGANIGGISMGTTNDMPIVYPASFATLGLVGFNINPHFISGRAAPQHMGETRETRIAEFLTQNDTPVVGLPEGSWIQVMGQHITLEGSQPALIFERDKQPYELPVGSELSFKK